MPQELTDEQVVAHSDELIEKVAKAMAATCRFHAGVTVEALSQVLYMVIGQSWMSGSDMARARIKAKALIALPPEIPDFIRRTP